MSEAPYLFQEMNDEPAPKPQRHRRPYAMSPAVRTALAGLKQTMNSIPKAELEQRQRRWNDLQRDLKKNRLRPQDEEETPRRRSAALDPS